jgi:RimJ/RimL family protein N-acetyltransferase
MVSVKLLRDDYLLASAGVVLRPVTLDSLELYRSLVASSIGFFNAFEGGLPPDDELANTFTDLPPGCSLEAKNSIGVFDDTGRMIGFVDIVADYPDADSWYIGWLLLAEDVRRRGLGGLIVAALESLVATAGGCRLYLAVYDANIVGRAFWQAMGFVPEKHVPDHTNASGQPLPTTRLRKLLDS